MRIISLNNNTYKYSYKAHDLFATLKLCGDNNIIGAMEYCAGLLVDVVDTEENAVLRLELGQLILADLSAAVESTQKTKNSPTPSSTGKP